MNSRWKGFESPLAQGIERFLKHKRAVGRQFQTEEWALRLLDRFLVEQQLQTIDEVTTEVLDAFLMSRPRRRPRSYNHLLGVLRRLFNWLVARGTLNRSPLRDQTRRGIADRIPFIFDAEQVSRLLSLAGGLPEACNAQLRGPSYRTIFALLYALGLRVGEVCRLRIEDVDRERRLLIIRQTKFAKNRLVPYGPRIGDLLRQYLSLRESGAGSLAPDDPVFSLAGNRPISRGTIGTVFRALISRLELKPQPGSAPPRVHSLRHSFAVGTLLRWYREGIDPAARLLHLSTFLGHAQPESTAVYLTITGELLDVAGDRFEKYTRPVREEVPR
jgi:site-specific recombinase XerD